MRAILRLLAGMLPVILGIPAAQAAEPVTVFAAASMTNALEAAGAAYRAKTGDTIRFSFASSSTLARQIERGAPAQIYVSADEAWMNYLAERRLIEAKSRISPIGNRLVLIAPADSTLHRTTIDASLDIPSLLGAGGRLSIGDPAHVPAGTYAKQALQSLELWARIEPRIAPAENVRVALAFVERAEAALGIVYATDAAATPKVKVIGVFPKDSHTPVTYPFAIVKGKGTPDVAAAFDFLTGEDGQKVYESFGFVRD